MEGGKLYVKKYTQGLTREIIGFDMPVKLPDMPPKEEMVNFGLPKLEQKFKRTIVPPDIHGWEKEAEREFVRKEWHKRRHGVWILIKGDPYYLTGPAYVFFNYWYTQMGELADFRMEAVEFFQIYEMAERDPDCFGLLDIKPRRVGDTEKVTFLGWERVTRYRNSAFGMQNKNDDDAWKNFNRIAVSNKRMVYFFKPKHKGKDVPQSIIEFSYPVEQEKREKVANRKKAGNIRELSSKIDFRPTVTRAYDGERLSFFHGDEPGKVSPSVMDWREQWKIVLHCLALNNGETIIGKAILSTTIEQISGVDSVEVMAKFCEDSNVKKKNELGRTTSGLWLVFRGYWLVGKEDEWGFHDVENVTRRRAAEIADMEAKGQMDEIVAYKRKMPASLEEALAIPETDCILHPHLIDTQTSFLQEKAMLKEPIDNAPRTGFLEWTDGFGSNVKWVPNPNGRWQISGHPEIPNNSTYSGGARKPGNAEIFACGCDPIDDYKPKAGASRGALTVMRLPDLSSQVALMGESDAIQDKKRVDDRCVCTYQYRPNDPYEYFEDALKTWIYYGTLALVEKTKPAILRWAADKQFGHYLAWRPKESKVPDGMRNARELGIPANTETIQGYVMYIKKHNLARMPGHTHVELLQDMRKFNGEKDNRTKRDLTVAWGWTLTLANSIQNGIEKKKTKKKFRFAIKTYTNGRANVYT